MQQSLDERQTDRAGASRSIQLTELAEAWRHTDQIEKAFALLNEALTVMEQTGERFYEAELYRVRGALSLAPSVDNRQEAETCFHQALDIAHRQCAKSWELRAATSLARLWLSQGKRMDAYHLLAPLYAWFTEGFDTADLIEAKSLLDALTKAQSVPRIERR